MFVCKLRSNKYIYCKLLITSIDSVIKLVDKPSEFIKKVINRYKSQGGSVGRITREIEMEEKVDLSYQNPDLLHSILYLLINQNPMNLKKIGPER